MIELRAVSKSYGEKTVLSKLDLTFLDGGDYCITGPSGTGKTTLLLVLMGIVAPDSGEIFGVAGRRIAPVFQEDRLCMNLSVGANIRLTARQRPAAAEITELLDVLMLPKSERQPVSGLSGGMRRRVCIARAMLSGGDLWLFDEPFSSLDARTKLRVMDEILARREGRTMIWVSHDLSDAQYMGSEVVELTPHC